ncbi:hypothetical protein SODALDRAFT_319667 [Sodiomyces alkalinus F11]|uniref:Nucleolar protein 12 n=1 Tax=Sodiomyces alkalinus (strain CBS 110278 / VKM F-3762 / F11) TaxID=1314773 RepID=A0A3N2Q940_SODAK|nr:hypothetical protein SODALDRAFT_319667 [Sodiomyces alkalinus F11]ROT43145.1 hypothetical protein SODALDRAFT_319667 [Sodiomyces alkalinus F11]
MFAKPRIRKTVPPPPKKRKTISAVEEVNFDFDAREEYLTGFHKRKLQRIKYAQEQAAKKAREEKLQLRKQLREERKREVEEHVQTVNRLLREAQAADSGDDQEIQAEDFEEWDGIEEEKADEPVDHEDEYIDEDRYTTVKVEAVSVTRDGFEKIRDDEPDREQQDEEDTSHKQQDDGKVAPQKNRLQKKKKPKFRYETKLERRTEERKQKAKKRARFKTQE